MIMITIALFWVFPNYFPGFSFQIVLLALSAVSSLLNVYRFVRGFSNEELLNIMRRYNGKVVAAKLKREIDRGQNREQTMKTIGLLKEEIDQFLDEIGSDED